MTPLVLFLWGPPRSLSTAFLRMMLERDDFTVVHEPFSSIVVQGYAMVAGEKVSNESDLVDALQEYSRIIRVFVKETTEYRYAVLRDPRLTEIGTHSFIIRHPEKVIASHYAMNEQVTCAEIGYEHQFEIFELVRRRTGRPPVVIEAERLAADPSSVVRRYCACVGIPFESSVLSWSPGDRVEWRRTREWHRDVAMSSGFANNSNKYPVTIHNSVTLMGYYKHHYPFYEHLRSYSEVCAHPVGPAGQEGCSSCR